ncbi:MAG: hypothetical protein DRQ39_05150 [Gammaproteobacteria bacterium]|nr:MAG: hypothetical protein DRQ39_05150 [Gammaproteobacteria bacterium]
MQNVYEQPANLINYRSVLNIQIQRGFTLYELIVTLSIVVILLTLAAPNFISTVQRNQVYNRVNELHSILNLTRSEAIKRASFLSLCSSSDVMNCNNSMSWSDGWILFMDRDGDGVFEDDGDTSLCEINEDCILKVANRPSNGITFTANVSVITFDLNGLPMSTATYTVSALNCRNDSQVIVNTTGRAHVQSDC